jgi:2-keto-4-pentenoate hydratase
LARLLVAARADHRAIKSVPDDLVPVDLVEAQLVDDRVAVVNGRPVLGWKIGATSEAAQTILGADGPFAGRVYTILGDGAELSADRVLGEPRIEGEFAFTLGTDLTNGSDDQPGPSGEVAVDRASVIAAIADVRPAIEVVGGRFQDMFDVPLECLAADAGTNGLLVLGQPVPVEQFDLGSLGSVSATMTVDGRIVGEGVGADVYGGPIEALVWLANHLAARGIPLRAGQVVTTGTATQIADLAPGSSAMAQLDGIGTVSVHRPG